MAKEIEDPLIITRIVRRLPGSSQAHEVQCADGKFYVAKFSGNPQGNRTLINEWLMSHLMNVLGVRTPKTRILYLPPDMPQSDAIYAGMGTKRVPFVDDLHFGSLHPVNPQTTVIFDDLPAKFLPRLVNLSDFASRWVIKTWSCQADHGRAVFVQEGGDDPSGFRAYMIGHGMVFNGTNWKLTQIVQSKKDPYERIYRLLDMPTECDRALLQINDLAKDLFSDAIRSAPPRWFMQGDREKLEVLIDSLWDRAERLPSIIDHDLEVLLESLNSSPPIAIPDVACF